MRTSMKDGTVYDIVPCAKDRWFEATELAFRVFMKYEAKEYGQKGIDSFAEFLTSPSLEKVFKAGKYIVYVAMLNDEIIGVTSVRSGNHLSLLFVNDSYHRQGIATKLILAVKEYLLNKTDYKTLTVHSSPYGIPFYEKMGFKATDEQLTGSDGIIYTPMELDLCSF